MYLYASVVIQYFFRPQSSSAHPSALNMGPAQAAREAACVKGSLGPAGHFSGHRVDKRNNKQCAPGLGWTLPRV